MKTIENQQQDMIKSEEQDTKFTLYRILVHTRRIKKYQEDIKHIESIAI